MYEESRGPWEEKCTVPGLRNGTSNVPAHEHGKVFDLLLEAGTLNHGERPCICIQRKETTRLNSQSEASLQKRREGNPKIISPPLFRSDSGWLPGRVKEPRVRVAESGRRNTRAQRALPGPHAPPLASGPADCSTSE